MLAEKLKNYTIILASSSPRRQQFLRDLGLEFTCKSVDIKEIYPKELKGTEITDFLAELKSDAFLSIAENEIIITSDTIVWLDNMPLEKPNNEKEAFKMLRLLSNKTHQVITSVCIKLNDIKITFNDTTDVTFRELSDDEINYYIKNYKPFDKAGSYGIQEWIGKIGVTEIRGSYFNVMGLPVNKLYDELLKLTNKTN